MLLDKYANRWQLDPDKGEGYLYAIPPEDIAGLFGEIKERGVTCGIRVNSATIRVIDDMVIAEDALDETARQAIQHSEAKMAFALFAPAAELRAAGVDVPSPQIQEVIDKMEEAELRAVQDELTLGRLGDGKSPASKAGLN